MDFSEESLESSSNIQTRSGLAAALSWLDAWHLLHDVNDKGQNLGEHLGIIQWMQSMWGEKRSLRRWLGWMLNCTLLSETIWTLFHLFDFSPLCVLKWLFSSVHYQMNPASCCQTIWGPHVTFGSFVPYQPSISRVCIIKRVVVRPSGARFHSRHDSLEDTIAHQEVADYIVKYRWQISLANIIGKYITFSLDMW